MKEERGTMQQDEGKQHLKPIETIYNGYCFRSRLEARWAVFFDILGVPYQYEKEGFDLGEAGWYLPDFWISDWHTWIEIKPHLVTPGLSDARNKCRALFDSSGQRVLLLQGDCYLERHIIWAWDTALNEDDLGLFAVGSSLLEFRECRRCQAIWLTAEEDWGTCLGPSSTECRGCSDRCPILGPRLEQAYTAARQARFERRK